MTVKELKEKIKDLPDDMTVLLFNPEHWIHEGKFEIKVTEVKKKEVLVLNAHWHEHK